MSDATLAVCERDYWRCFRCGENCFERPHSVHHRVLGNRRDNRHSNLILLCGTGTTGCHGWVHNHPKLSRDEGWIVSKFTRQDTSEVPVLHHQLGRVRLDDNGGMIAYASGG